MVFLHVNMYIVMSETSKNMFPEENTYDKKRSTYRFFIYEAYALQL